MKKLCRKLSLGLLAAFAMMALAFCAACASKYANGEVAHAQTEVVVIEVTEAEEGATVKDAMRTMAKEGKIVFVEDGTGMILSINGYVGNGGYWMLYTSSVEFSNDAWGSYVYDGTNHGSAILGYASLPAEVGKRYIWVYTVF